MTAICKIMTISIYEPFRNLQIFTANDLSRWGSNCLKLLPERETKNSWGIVLGSCLKVNE